MHAAISPEKKRRFKIYLALLFFAAILGWAVWQSTWVIHATQIGIVNTQSSNLTVRSGPGTNYEAITSLARGSQVTILGEENGWYQVNYGAGEGYVLGTYIRVEEAPVDNEYVTQLVNAGFPESYARSLAVLHEKHSTWVFEPVLTGLDWNTVIEKESVLNVNMVPVNANDSWKSTASGAYKWSTNQWTILDGSSWVGASEAIIAYCMDPRNFLDETNIYQFETLHYAEYQNEADVANVLAGTFMAGALRGDETKTYSETFVEAGVAANVNPTHLAARCKQEQGLKGTSPLISGTYEGYEGLYNYFNIGAYGTPVSVLYQRGLKTAKNNGWTDPYLSIVGGAAQLADKYINLGQNTLYFQKFNVTNSYSGLFRHQYMANVQAAISEGKTIGKAYSNKEQSFVFQIPVYDNMPQSPCPMPDSGNPNNWLKSMKISGGNLTPAFRGQTTEYSVIVADTTEEITVEASAVASTSSVEGYGTVALNYGDNVIKVTCTAQNGSAREYAIHVVRQGKPAVAKGDVNGDGEVSLLDLLAVKRHILNIEVLTEDRFRAADIDGSESVDLVDYLKIKRHILGYEQIG